MNVTVAEGKSLFLSMGVTKVDAWSPKRLQTKLNNLPALLEDPAVKEPEGKEEMALLKKITSALEEGEEITVEGAKEENGNGKKGTGGKSPEQRKPEKKVTPKREKAERGIGVIGSIVDILKSAGKEGVTKKEIVTKLAKKFPDRDSDSMAKTVNVQVPSRIKKEKGLNVVRTEAGGYLVAEKAAKKGKKAKEAVAAD